MVSGHQFSFQELKEQVEDEAQYGEDDNSCHEAFGNHEVAVVEDQGADALFGGNHFGRHQKEESGAGGGLRIASLRGATALRAEGCGIDAFGVDEYIAASRQQRYGIVFPPSQSF